MNSQPPQAVLAIAEVKYFRSAVVNLLEGDEWLVAVGC